MKSPLTSALFAAVAVCALSTAPPTQAADVGVSVQISQPGVYGRVDIGRFPQPQVWQAPPVVIVRPTVIVQQPAPVYMWVPPGHRKKWGKHCAAYNACGVPVYFVRDQWYEAQVRPHEQGRGRDGEGDEGHGKGKGKNKDKGHGKHRD